MIPSPGRIVLYMHHLAQSRDEELPAIVLFVQRGRLSGWECKLHVFGTNEPMAAGWVRQNETEPVPVPDTWRWPPRVESARDVGPCASFVARGVTSGDPACANCSFTRSAHR